MTKNLRPYLFLVGAFICIGLSAGVLINAVSMFLAPVAGKIGTDVGAVGIFFSLNSAMAAASAFVAPKLLEKGVKVTTLITIGGIGGALAMLLMGLATSLWMVIVAGLCAGFCSTLCCNGVFMPMLNRWFMYNRGTLAAVMGIGEWLFATIFSTVGAHFVQSGNYETACFITAGIMIVAFLFCNYVLVKGYPEDLGMKPVGYDKYMKELEAAGATKANSDEMPGLTKQQIYHKSAFWMYLIMTGLTVVAVNFYYGQQTTIYLGAGLTAMQAASLISVYAAAKVINKVVVGFVADRISLLFSGFYTIAMVIVGIILFMTGEGYVPMLIGAICCGSAQGFPAMISGLGMAKIVGQKSLGQVGMLPFGTTSVGGAVGPLLFAALYAGGNLKAPLTAGIVCWAVCLVLFVLVMRKKNLVENDGRRKAG